MAGGYDGGVSEVFSAVGQAVAVEGADCAAGFLEDALGCAGVPLHRWDEARVQVSRALGDEAEIVGFIRFQIGE